MAQVRVVLKSVFDDKGLKSAQSGFAKIGQGIDSAFRAVTVGVGLATAAIGKFGVDAIKEASNLQESTNAVNVAFRDAARGVLAIGESSAESLGIARSEFNQAAVRFSAFAERVVGQGGDVAGFIRDITTRAADFASVFNIDVAEALQVFQSGLSGEAEPLKRFGINLLDTEVKAYAVRSGMIAVGESMTEAEKVQARYGLLMESTNKTAGDFANTSDSLANQQRILNARFQDLQGSIGQALLPAVTDLVGQVGDRLLPLFEEFGDFLNSPRGKKAIQDTADAIGNFFEFIVENIDTLIDVAVKVTAFVAALKILKTALELATIAQTLFNVAVRANPYVIAATALIALAGGMALVADYAIKAENEANKQAQSVAALEEEARRLREAFQDGLIPQDKYRAKMDEIEQAIKAAGGSVEGTVGELNRLNNIKLDGLRGQLRESVGELNRFANIAKSILPKNNNDDDQGGGGGGGGAKGPSAFEQTQKIIKDAQKKLEDARERYDKAITSARTSYDRAVIEANKTYTQSLTNAETQRDKSLADALKAHTQNIASIQRDFAKRQAEIIQQSIDRLRNAYASAVRANVADLFDTEAVGKSINNLITNLRERLTASRTLVANTALLASRGFSQTFLEQIVGSGLETGNELAKAILEATPETQRELQALFGALETESETGMDSLAKTMYDKTGLATTELKKLYAQTFIDLKDTLAQAELSYAESQASILASFDDAMLQAQKSRDDAFDRANQSLNDALASARDQYLETLSDIREAFEEQIKALEGKLGGLAGTVKNFRALLASLMGGKLPANLQDLLGGATGGVTSGTNLLTGATVDVVQGLDVSAKSVKGATGLLIDSAADVGNSLAYLDARIANAFKYATNVEDTNAAAAASARATAAEFIAQRQALANAGENAVGTVININVKTDSTQSLAMVGRTLGNTITKYVTTGGEVLVSTK